MNVRMIGRYLGYLLWCEAAFLLPSAGVGLYYGEHTALLALLATAALCGAAGTLLYFICRTAPRDFYAREGFVVAGAGWLFISLFGCLPFLFSGEIPHFIDAFFETVSGFTTTGASIVADVEGMSRCLLFWRSFTHWLGGVGVLAFVLTVVRAQKGSGFTVHLLRAESPGPKVGKMMPKMHESVRMLYIVYIGLSLLNLLFLLAGGMSLFDALCCMFGTAGTGGFGFVGHSMASFSPYLQNVTTVFMALFGINFSLYFLLLRRDWRSILKDEELRGYIGIMLLAIALITVNIFSMYDGFGEALRHAAFTVSSVMTTTGYTTTDFALFPQFSRALLLVVMIIGAMAGSTGGGVKVSRFVILLKSFKAQIHRLLHPRSVKAVRVNGKTVEDHVVSGVYFYICVYAAIAMISFILISLDGMTMETNLSAVLACLNNIGPGLAQVGPEASFAGYSVFSKTVLSINMLLGRLEVFPVLLLIMPATWKHKT